VERAGGGTRGPSPVLQTGEIKRHADVVGVFPNEAAFVRLVGVHLLEQNNEWAVQRARYMTLETTAPLSRRSRCQPSRNRPAHASKRANQHSATPRQAIARKYATTSPER
jgi:hypothetical protein